MNTAESTPGRELAPGIGRQLDFAVPHLVRQAALTKVGREHLLDGGNQAWRAIGDSTCAASA
jgi:hypothetical protein